MKILFYFKLVILFVNSALRCEGRPNLDDDGAEETHSHPFKREIVSASTYIPNALQYQSRLDIISEHNPNVLNVSSHIEQSARSNLDLRLHIQKEERKFDLLFKQLKNAQKDLAAAKKRLLDIQTAAIERNNIVKSDMRHWIQEERFNVHKLHTKYKLVKKTVEENKSKEEDTLKRLQEKATDANIGKNDMMSKVSNLMQTASQLASSVINPIAGPMDLVNVVPLLGV